MRTYDIIVVGAGIAGCCSAYFLHQKGLEVLVVDRSGVAAAGGSSAAGAFVSPKIGKGSPLQSLTNEAFLFAKDFYLQNFPQHFYQTGVIRIPKDQEDAQKFIDYESHNSTKYRWVLAEELLAFGIREEHNGFLFVEAGFCDAPKMCEAILEGIDYVQYELSSLSYEDGYWCVGEYRANNLLLATGYENRYLDMRYMGVKGTWGSRGDYYSSLPLKHSMHKSISISANVNGIIKIGATHNKGVNICMKCDGEPLRDLFEKASSMVDTSDFKLKETYCGMRSGSKDYFPLVGGVVDTNYMLETYPKILKGAKPPLKKVEHLYICNGLGGRGFVFAPMMAKMLAEHIVEGKEIDRRVDPDRLFLKWCRKSPELDR
jgi:tRNA 5-methylaminomethyl-2-thiouridine biosynthesis bifunctional protein